MGSSTDRKTDARQGDVWLLVRARGGANPKSENARLRRFVNRLGRAYGFDVVKVMDAEPTVPLEIRDDDGDAD